MTQPEDPHDDAVDDDAQVVEELPEPGDSSPADGDDAVVKDRR